MTSHCVASPLQGKIYRRQSFMAHQNSQLKIVSHWHIWYHVPSHGLCSRPTCPDRPPKQDSPMAHHFPQGEFAKQVNGRGRGPSCTCWCPSMLVSKRLPPLIPQSNFGPKNITNWVDMFKYIHIFTWFIRLLHSKRNSISWLFSHRSCVLIIRTTWLILIIESCRVWRESGMQKFQDISCRKLGLRRLPVFHSSHEKNPLTFHYTGCFIEILIMVYYSPNCVV